MAMALGVLMPTALAGVILNDVGPDLPPAGLTVAEVRAALAARSPDHAAALTGPDIRAAVSVRVVGEDAHVPVGAEVAFFSPFSGG